MAESWVDVQYISAKTNRDSRISQKFVLSIYLILSILPIYVHRTCIFWPYVVQLSAACLYTYINFHFRFIDGRQGLQKVWTWTSKLQFFSLLTLFFSLYSAALLYLFLSYVSIRGGKWWFYFLDLVTKILLIFTSKLDLKNFQYYLPHFFIMIFCIIVKFKMSYINYTYTLAIKI